MLSDPFDVLGIQATATDEDVVTAFRGLAKKWHPDVSKAPDAATRLREVCEARDILMDPALKAAALARRAEAQPAPKGIGDSFETFFQDIDRFGRGREMRSPPKARRGVDLEREAWISLEQAHAGGRLRLADAPGPCVPCQGTGRVEAVGVPCPGCEGRGSSRRARGILTVEVTCPDCSGSGRVPYATCEACGGTRQGQGAGLGVEVPPGTRDGMRVRHRGMGAPGINGGPPGDLTVVVRVKDHPVFERKDQDLTAGIEVPVWDAALGTERTMRGIDGASLVVRVPPGTQGGTVLVLQGQGLRDFPGRGDLRVVVAVTVPDASSGPMRGIFEGLRAASVAG